MAMTDETPLARIVRFRGAVCSLAGTVPALGAVVPDFRLSRWWDAERINVTLESALAVGRPMLFSVVQSVDGHVSQVQVKTFDRQLAEFQGRHMECSSTRRRFSPGQSLSPTGRASSDMRKFCRKSRWSPTTMQHSPC